MARAKQTVVIEAAGRDYGKTFTITEMPADQGEHWANRMIVILLTANAKLAQEARDAGMAGLAAILPSAGGGRLADTLKWLAGVRYDEIKPLLDEQMECVRYIHPGPAGVQPQPILHGVNSQIEDIATRWELRNKWLELHLGFLLAGAESTTESPPQDPPA